MKTVYAPETTNALNEILVGMVQAHPMTAMVAGAVALGFFIHRYC